jgi:hypothetical protein
MAPTKEEPTVPVSEVLGQQVECLVREGRRRRGGAGVRDPQLDSSAAALADVAARFGTLLLPVSASIADAFEDVLTADESGVDDAAVWSAAASCSLHLPGTFHRFSTQIMSLTSRFSRQEPPRASPWLGDEGIIRSWNQVLMSAADSQVDAATLREYADTLPRVQFPQQADARVQFLGHVRAVLAFLEPMSPTLNRAAVTWVSTGLLDKNLGTRSAAYELRAALAVLLHPRCAPLHVPVVAPAATASGPLTALPQGGHHDVAPFGDAQVATRSIPAGLPARSQTFVAPAAPANANAPPPAEPQVRKIHRTEAKPVAAVSAPKPDAVADDFEMPEIVDDDL